MPDTDHRKRSSLPDGQVSVDPDGRVRDWFNPGGVAVAAVPLAPEEVARGFLHRHAAAFDWAPGLADLRPTATLKAPGGFSVRFAQEHHGLPVYGIELVVNLYADSRVHSVYSQYRYDIPDLRGDAARVDALGARRLVARLTRMFRQRAIPPAELVVYRYQEHGLRPATRTRRSPRPRKAFVRLVRAHLARRPRPAEGEYLLAWQVAVATQRPPGHWRFVVDAVSGRLVDVVDELAYATGRGKVFDPNPIVTSGNPGWSSATPAGALDGQRVEVDLEDLDPPGADGKYRLDGGWVHMEDYALPTFAEPASKKARFRYSWTNRKFLDVMAYFHIERFQTYLRNTLEIENVAAFSVRVDTHGHGGSDLATASADQITFGEGGIPNASDAMIILHEYGHVIEESIRPSSSNGNHATGVSEGFPDFLAAVYYDDKHVSAATRGTMFSWDSNPTDAFRTARSYALSHRFDGCEWAAAEGAPYGRGAIWCSVMFELYRKLGGDSPHGPTQAAARDLAIRLHLAANFGIPARYATLTQVVQQLEAADASLGGWRYADSLHRKVIRDTFARRGTPGYAFPPVDVYVFDGREGGYGAPDGLDAFAGKLWKAELGDTPDIWLTTGPSQGAAPSTPRVGQPVSVYVRVKNRGNAGSGPVTVRAFGAAAPAMCWPADWVPLDPAAPSLTAPDVPPLPAAGVVVGPFTWVPAAAGPASILVIVECAADPAVTESLPANASVPHLDLVPFDNNIALRDFAVLP